ncbi:MAG: hypothetical protein J2P17_34870 [Mycobacterium sp.]|nr:hypothetical protein [Mycobacterium sp.]
MNLAHLHLPTIAVALTLVGSIVLMLLLAKARAVKPVAVLAWLCGAATAASVAVLLA